MFVPNYQASGGRAPSRLTIVAASYIAHQEK